MNFSRRWSSSLARTSFFKWRNTDGIFGLDDFRKADDLMPIARRTRRHCEKLYQDCLAARSKTELLSLMDEISNNLCSVMDLAICIRQIHPHMHFKSVASKCLQFMQPQFQLMNTSRELYEKFHELDYDGSCVELKRMNSAFGRDFEMTGIGNGNVDKVSELNQRAEYLSRILETSEYEDSFMALSHLVQVRHELAQTLGFESFAAMSLKESWFKTVENLKNFLQNRPRTLQNVDLHKSEIPKYTIQQIIDGFGKLISDKLQLEMKMVPCHFTWAFGLISLEIHCKSSGEFLGSIYFDAQSRENKPTQSSHYTIIGSKSAPTNNVVFNVVNTPQRPKSLIAASIENDQIIDYFKAQTVIHEFGHALHAILSKTKYQSLSGTRCHLEIAEFPSTFLECQFEDKDIQGKYFGVDSHDEFFEKLKLIRLIHQEETCNLALIDIHVHSAIPEGHDWVRKAIRSVYDGDLKELQLKHLAVYGSHFYTYSLANCVVQSMKSPKTDPWPVYRRLLDLGGLLDVDSIGRLYPGIF